MSAPETVERKMQRPYFWPVCIVLAIVGVFLAINPFLEAPINDDWTYTRMAQMLLQTGRLHFDGWTNAMVGAHALWGAIFIKLNGFSFTVLRFSTLVTAVGCGLLCNALCRRLGLTRATSAFTALTLMLSPLTIALTATFMTDITGLLLSLLILYSAVRCVQAVKTSTFIAWLLAIVGAGILGGSVRQVLF